MTKSTSESRRNRNAALRPTIVSLAFDDGTADAQHSIKATFYVNSNKIGRTSPLLTWDELSDLAADGNEVGGHTPDHVDLTKVRTTEATRMRGSTTAYSRSTTRLARTTNTAISAAIACTTR